MNEQNLTHFQPGNPGGPGRPPEASAVLKKYTKKAIAQTFVDLMEMSVDELKKVRSDSQETGLRFAVASVILKCGAKGEFCDLNYMLDRIIGKVPQKTELTGDDGAPLLPPQVILRPIEPRDRPIPPKEENGT